MSPFSSLPKSFTALPALHDDSLFAASRTSYNWGRNYAQAWHGVPERWRRVIEGAGE